MEHLAEALCECLKRAYGQRKQLFSGETILVQSPGMAQWLKLNIAEKHGIAANLDFPLPSSYIWELYRQFIPDLPAQSAFTKDNMSWKIFHLLPELLSSDEFKDIAAYLTSDEEVESEQNPNQFKLYQLSVKIADVFDQYLMYRPQWLDIWQSGTDTLHDTDVSQHPWQPILWRSLVQYSDALEESPLHRANLHQQLLLALNQDENKIKVSNNLYVFGISAMPEQQLQILEALAQHMDVTIFWFNPSEHYWGDLVDEKRKRKIELQEYNAEVQTSSYLDTGNPLLASWGKLGRDYLDMLLTLDIQQHDLFEYTEGQHLLAHIQSEIMALEFRGCNTMLEPEELLTNGNVFPKISVDDDDHSVQFYSCHSRVRELEVLQDRLYSLFDQDPALSPAEIIVMMPDVGNYAPYIEAVFSAKGDQAAIPFAISDRNVGEESPLILSFLQLMQLHQSRFTLAEILDIFSVPAILRRYDVGDGEFNQIQHWLQNAGVRWAIDGQHKQQWSVPLNGQNSWLFGLQRLISGYGLAEDHMQGSDVSPYRDIEGQGVQGLGKFYLFFMDLQQVLEFCQRDGSMSEKVSGACEWLDKCYLGKDDDDVYLLQLRQLMEQLLVHEAQYPETIEQDTFVHYIQQNLTQKGVGQRFLAGAVNFCTLMPMRSIPFKHVCLLGMNDGDYPRQMVPIGFDLMKQALPQRGDRSRRLDDRYLFLEALLSARDSFYISYLGRSSKDNSELAPSVLMSELQDYCLDTFCLTEDNTLAVETTRQNMARHLSKASYLQPFNPASFSQDQRRSYLMPWLSVAQAKTTAAENKAFWYEALPTLPLASVLSVEGLCQFYQNPAKAFFIQRWQTGFARAQDELPQQEPFKLDPLQRYQLNHRLVEQPNLAGHSLRAEGILPFGQVGELALKPLRTLSDALAQQLSDLAQEQKEQSLEIGIQLPDVRLEGWISGIYGKRLIKWRPGKIRTKDRMNLWLEWLMLSARGYGLTEACFIGTDDCFMLQPIKGAPARLLLEEYVQWWKTGLEQPLLFFPETGWQWLKTQNELKTLQVFNGNNFVAGEGQEAHIKRICPDLSQEWEEFDRQVQGILGPLYRQGDEHE